MHARYEQVLADEKALDFHDLINLAALHIREGRGTTPYRYVLVDEFQDISKGRMALLQAIARRHQTVAYFLVGDDWQSIYRFAGSDVGLVRNCGAYLGYTRQQTLSQTFRFGNRVLGPSTAFVQRQPPVSGESYPFAEERRLFYVAMTRSRMGTYLITDRVRPSTFVTELLRESGDVRRLGDLAPECPRCLSGRLILSQTGLNMRCTKYALYELSGL